jgi:hypothetical protein
LQTAEIAVSIEPKPRATQPNKGWPMFGWFKKKTAVDPQKENFLRHVEKAEGSPFVRFRIGSAMCSVEEEGTTKGRNKRPASEQWKFMVTYECFVTYALRIGVERVLGPNSFHEAHKGIGLHFIKHAEFFPDLWLEIWGNLDAFVTAANNLGKDAPDTPIGKLTLAALTNKTLFPNGLSSDHSFSGHLGFELQAVASFAEQTTDNLRQRNMLLYWFSLNWKIARFELAGKGCRPLKRSRDCTGA